MESFENTFGLPTDSAEDWPREKTKLVSHETFSTAAAVAQNMKVSDNTGCVHCEVCVLFVSTPLHSLSARRIIVKKSSSGCVDIDRPNFPTEWLSYLCEKETLSTQFLFACILLTHWHFTFQMFIILKLNSVYCYSINRRNVVIYYIHTHTQWSGAAR